MDRSDQVRSRCELLGAACADEQEANKEGNSARGCDPLFLHSVNARAMMQSLVPPLPAQSLAKFGLKATKLFLRFPSIQPGITGFASFAHQQAAYLPHSDPAEATRPRH